MSKVWQTNVWSKESAFVSWELCRACWHRPSRFALIWGSSKWMTSWSARKKASPISRNLGLNDLNLFGLMLLFSDHGVVWWWKEMVWKHLDREDMTDLSFLFVEVSAWFAQSTSCPFSTLHAMSKPWNVSTNSIQKLLIVYKMLLIAYGATNSL